MEVDIETIKTLCQKHCERGYRDVSRNFLQLAAKIMHVTEGYTECEYDWLKYLTPLIDYRLVVLPKPHGELITHGHLTILVMDYIGGVTVEELIINGKSLSDDDVNRICDAYGGNKTTFEMDEIAWNHGDLSPKNIKLLDDGRVAFYDFEISLWGPPE